MTQAFNLSQLANNLNSSGQLDATDGLVNAVPVANGGTGASTYSAAQTNLHVPDVDGTGATGEWPIDISGNAATASSTTDSTNAENLITADWTVSQSGSNLVFKYNGSTVITLSSSGAISASDSITSAGSITGNG